MNPTSLNTKVAVAAWAAFAPGLTTGEDWVTWAGLPVLPHGAGGPEVKEMPAMLRRRLNALGRMVSHVAYACPSQTTSMPVVFASRYGDAERALGLLKDLADGAALSPSGFGLSVHNAVGAMVSIARGDKNNYVSVAGGVASGFAGLIEASALLADGVAEVLLVHYDTPLPEAYVPYQDESLAPFAWALRLVAAQEGAPYLRVSGGQAGEGRAALVQQPCAIPLGLEMLCCVIRAGSSVERVVRGFQWRMEHHA